MSKIYKEGESSQNLDCNKSRETFWLGKI